MADTASSWLSKIWAGPVNTRLSSLTPAVLTTQPLGAILPESTAKPPSNEKALARLRIQPFSLSSSKVSQRQSWLKALVVRIPAGPAR